MWVASPQSLVNDDGNYNGKRNVGLCPPPYRSFAKGELVMLVIISSVSLLAAFLSVMVPIWCDHRTRHHLSAQADTETAYKSATKLLKDEKTPRDVAMFVRAFAGLMTTSRVSRALVWDVLTGKFSRTTQAKDSKRAFSELSPEAVDELNRFLVHVLLASASRDPLFAWLTRRIILFGLMGQSESEVRDSRAVIVDLSRQFKTQGQADFTWAKA